MGSRHAWSSSPAGAESGQAHLDEPGGSRSGWRALALHVLEQEARPAGLIDADGRVICFNAVLTRVLGWQRDQLHGRSWIDLCPREGDQSVARSLLQSPLTGAGRSCELEWATRNGAHQRVRFDLHAFGYGSDRVFVITVAEFTALPEARIEASSYGIHFEISTRPDDFGTIVACQDDRRRLTVVGRKCFELARSQAMPCPGCPVPRLATELRAIAPHTCVTGDRESSHVVVAQGKREGCATLSVLPLDDEVVSALVQAKVDRLAEASKLTERERALLELLLLGCALEDVAGALRISVRAVKYHQASLLEKLGAESRVDITRLLL